MRNGMVSIEPGYDGAYGKISIKALPQSNDQPTLF